MEKKTINILTVFFISHKGDLKTFLKQMVNQYSKGTHLHDPLLNYIKLYYIYTVHTNIHVDVIIHTNNIIKKKK